MRVVYKRYFKIILLSVQMLILQPLMLQNSVANDESGNIGEHSHLKHENNKDESVNPVWNMLSFALPSQNKSKYNTLLQNNIELAFTCSRSTTNKKHQKYQ